MFQAKRKRKLTKIDRYGQTDEDVNKDNFFDESETDASEHNESSYELSNDDDCVMVEEGKNTKSTISVKKQIAQVEAKLDGVTLSVQKILRMVISLTTNRTDVRDDAIAPNFHSIFPLKTEESMAKFEQDLSDVIYRNSVVISIFIGFFYLFVTLQVACHFFAAVYFIYTLCKGFLTNVTCKIKFIYDLLCFSVRPFINYQRN